MSAVGKWDVALLEVVTNGTQWIVVTHPDGVEKVFRVSWPTKAELDRGEAGIQRLWSAGIGIDFQWSDYENNTEALVKWVVSQEATYQAAVTGNPFQEVTVTFL